MVIRNLQELFLKKRIKEQLTNTTDYDILNELSLETNECLTKG